MVIKRVRFGELQLQVRNYRTHQLTTNPAAEQSRRCLINCRWSPDFTSGRRNLSFDDIEQCLHARCDRGGVAKGKLIEM